jgi:hypothetical protein
MLVRHAPCLTHPRLVPVVRAQVGILLLLLLLWVAPAHAGTVAIVRSLSTHPDLTETVSRLHGELLSVGLEVKMLNRSADRAQGQSASRAWLDELTAEGGLDAILDIVGDTAPVAVDIWVVEKSSQQFQVSRVDLEPNTENASERLAIRAIEVLRSSFLQNDMAKRERRSIPIVKPATATLPKDESDTPAIHVETFGFGVGAAALTSLDGVGPAILPVVRIDWALGARMVLQAQLAGMGSRPIVATTAGNARIAQQYAVLGGRYRLRSDQWLRPFFAFSAGVLRTAVEGQADSPRLGHTVNQWSFLMEGSTGMEFHLPEQYYLILAAHVHVAEPYVAVHIADTVAATTGRPNLLLTLTLGAWL